MPTATRHRALSPIFLTAHFFLPLYFVPLNCTHNASTQISIHPFTASQHRSCLDLTLIASLHYLILTVSPLRSSSLLILTSSLSSTCSSACVCKPSFCFLLLAPDVIARCFRFNPRAYSQAMNYLRVSGRLRR